MAVSNVQKNETKKERIGFLKLCRRLLLWVLIFFVGFAIWFNGPGVRWLGPKIAKHYMAGAGLEGDLKIGGSVIGGLNIYDLDFHGDGSIERLVIDRLETDYRLSEIFSGKIRGISGENIRLELRLIEKEKEGKESMDLAKLGKTLKQVQGMLLPMDIDLENLNVSLKKNDERVFEFQESSLKHQAGSADISLVLGQVTDALGRTLPKQDPEIVWSDDKFTLDKIDLLHGLGIRDLHVSLPDSGDFEASGQIRMEDAVFQLDVGVGGKNARLDLIEGSLDLAQVSAGLGFKLPISGKLSALAVKASDVYPVWREGQATAILSVNHFSYGGWEFPDLALGVNLDEAGKIDAKLTGRGLNTEFTIDAMSRLEDLKLANDGKWGTPISGSIKVDRADRLLIALNQKLNWGSDFGKFPESTLAGKWEMDLRDGFQISTSDLELNPTKAEASPIRLNASYGGSVLKVSGLESAGLALTGRYDFGTSTYEASHVLKDFNSSSIEPWVKGFGYDLTGSGFFNMEWEGKGDFKKKSHQGKVSGVSVIWERSKKSEITASGGLVYDWPGSIQTSDWVMKTEGQQIRLDVVIENELLSLRRFVWLDGEEVIANGAGKIPVPKDFSKLKAFIAENSEPMEFDLKTEILPLSKLRPWVSGLDQFDGAAMAVVDLKLSGTFSAPVVDANLEITKLKSSIRPELPSADMSMKIAAKDGVANISAKIIASDFPPATFDATMPFLPKKWARDPESLQNEVIEGELKLPSLALSRFQALVPNARRLDGKLTGNAKISGKVGSPEINANLKLSDGRLLMKGDALPDFSGVHFDVVADLKRLSFKGGVDDISGGYLTIDGDFDTKGERGKERRDLDVRIKGEGLPIMRDENLILRSNADLTIKGPLESAQISGDLGIIDSVFYKDVELLPIGKPFIEPKPAKLPSMDTQRNLGNQIPDAFKEWTTDLKIKTIDPILIRGNLGEGAVVVDLKIIGRLGNPVPNGSIVLNDAVVRLPFSSLKVSKGILKFNAQTGFDPTLDLRATAEPRPYQVQVYAYGSMSNPQLVLTSQPPLPENEIMTLLASGTTTSGLEDTQQATSRAIRLLIEEFRRSGYLDEEELSPFTGLLDDVDFSIADPDPYTSDVYNSATLKLNDKWSVSAAVDAEGDQRMMLTWRLKFK